MDDSVEYNICIKFMFFIMQCNKEHLDNEEGPDPHFLVDAFRQSNSIY